MRDLLLVTLALVSRLRRHRLPIFPPNFSVGRMLLVTPRSTSRLPSLKRFVTADTKSDHTC